MKFTKKPLEVCYVTQPFGVNFIDFYKQWGLKGHNGVDLRAGSGTPVYAVCDGKVEFCKDSGYGNGAWITTKAEGDYYYEIVYAHLKEFFGKERWVTAGEQIGYADNTGIYTTGDHLHFGIRERLCKDKSIVDINNGYLGWEDPSPYFQDKAWSWLPVQRRYDRPDVFNPQDPSWRPISAIINEKKVALALTAYLKRFPTTDEINACTYGGWDREVLKNPALYAIWATVTKDFWTKNHTTPIRL